MLLFNSFIAVLDDGSLKRICQYVKHTNKCNKDPAFYSPDLKDGDVVIYYDVVRDNFFLIDVIKA